MSARTRRLSRDAVLRCDQCAYIGVLNLSKLLAGRKKPVWEGRDEAHLTGFYPLKCQDGLSSRACQMQFETRSPR